MGRWQDTIKMCQGTSALWCGLDSSGSGEGPTANSHERDHPSSPMKDVESLD